MTPDEQRIAIAEACGWKRIISVEQVMHYPGGMLDTEVHRWTPKQIKYQGQKLPIGGVFEEHELPDYLNDLNAMVEACKLLSKKGWRCVANQGTGGNWECFFTQSDEVMALPNNNDHYGAGDTLAEALAEAFLRTVSKWKDA